VAIIKTMIRQREADTEEVNTLQAVMGLKIRCLMLSVDGAPILLLSPNSPLHQY
jgi:hypothetical protein